MHLQHRGHPPGDGMLPPRRALSASHDVGSRDGFIFRERCREFVDSEVVEEAQGEHLDWGRGDHYGEWSWDLGALVWTVWREEEQGGWIYSVASGDDDTGVIAFFARFRDCVLELITVLIAVELAFIEVVEVVVRNPYIFRLLRSERRPR